MELGWLLSLVIEVHLRRQGCQQVFRNLEIGFPRQNKIGNNRNHVMKLRWKKNGTKTDSQCLWASLKHTDLVPEYKSQGHIRVLFRVRKP